MLPVIYTTKAEKYFKKLRDKALKKKFLDAIEVLREDPMAGEIKKHDLAGIMGYDVFHNKVNYEIAFEFLRSLFWAFKKIIIFACIWAFTETLLKKRKGGIL